MKPVNALRALITASSAMLTASAAPAGPPGYDDPAMVDRLATYGAQWAVSALRSVAEVRYGALDAGPTQGGLTITGLEISPFDSACTIEADRARLTSTPLTRLSSSTAEISFVGLRFNQACLDAADMGDLAAFGITDLAFERGRINLDYTFASGALTAQISAVSGGLAALDANVHFDYVGVNPDKEEPLADLANAEVELRNLGLMDRLAPMIPPAAGDPQALSQMLQGALLSGDNSDGNGGGFAEPGSKQGGKIDGRKGADAGSATGQAPAAPDSDMTALIDESAGAIAAFVTHPDRLVLRLNPPAPVRLTEATFADFATAARALAPQLAAGPSPVTAAFPAADLAEIRAALTDGAPLDAALALRAARALFTGIGAPRAPDRALTLLRPLLAAGNDEAVALALAQLDRLDPAEGYRIARAAAARGNRAAFARLDELESRLGMAGAIALQEESGPRVAPDVTAAAADLDARAFAAFTGLGAPRRYTEAYAEALLALAGGDTSATSTLDRIEALARRMAPADAERWRATLATIRNDATDAWFARQ